MNLSGQGYVVIGIMFLILVGGLFLQYFLSKSENKWLGLILPFLSFTLSLITVFAYENYDGSRGMDLILPLLYIFFIQNLPTMLLMAIYFAARSRLSRTSNLNKMKIKDL